MRFKKFTFTSVLLFLFLSFTSIQSQEIDLTSLDQLEDPANSGKTFVLKKIYDLQNNTLDIVPGITLKPAGGYFRNGSIGNVDFYIIEKRNRIFDYSINFLNLYPRPFLVEWFGARGNASNDDSRAIEKSILSANEIKLRNGIYFLNNPLNINRNGNIIIDANGAKIITSGFEPEPVLTLGNNFNQVRIDDLKVDGEGKNARGIEINSSFIGTKLNIQNFYGEKGKSIGLNVRLKDDSLNKRSFDVNIENCLINNIKSKNGGVIGKDEFGEARGIFVEWYGSFPNSNVKIKKNNLKNVIGEDGDVIFIAQKGNDYNNLNTTVIDSNYIGFGTRRLIKAAASNIKVKNNCFEIFPSNDPNAAKTNQTYMIGFQPFAGTGGLDSPFILGAEFINNKFIKDLSLDYGNSGGSLGLQQTNGAIVRDNNFYNSQIVFGSYNQETLITNNSLNHTNIIFAKDSKSFNNIKIINNKHSIFSTDSIQRANNIRGIITTTAPSGLGLSRFDDVTIENNSFDVYDPQSQDIAFINFEPATPAKNFKLLNNTLKKKTDTSLDQFLRTPVNFDSSSEITGNKLFADSNDRLDIVLNFNPRPVSFPFKYCENFKVLPNSTEILVTPSNTTPDPSCSNNSTKQITTIPISSSQLKISQNPVTNYINLKIADSTRIQYNIYDLYGRDVIDGTQESNNKEIDVSNLSSGVYLISIQSEGKFIVKRIIKE